jgi:hypothetical protein
MGEKVREILNCILVFVALTEFGCFDQEKL